MFLAFPDGEAVSRQTKKQDIACTFLQISFENGLHYDPPFGVIKKTSSRTVHITIFSKQVLLRRVLET